MPEPDAVLVSASVASTSKGIRYIGKHCFGHSGTVALANNTVAQFDFTSGAGYIWMTYTFGLDYSQLGDGQKVGFVINFNSEEIMRLVAVESASSETTTPIYFLIPPLTNVLIQGTTNASNANVFGVLAGRVYGTE